MVAVFVGFAFADVVMITSVGVGMAIALALALDATLARMLIVPETMRLLGRADWWPPGLLASCAPALAGSADPAR